MNIRERLQFDSRHLEILAHETQQTAQEDASVRQESKDTGGAGEGAEGGRQFAGTRRQEGREGAGGCQQKLGEQFYRIS